MDRHLERGETRGSADLDTVGESAFAEVFLLDVGPAAVFGDAEEAILTFDQSGTRGQGLAGVEGEELALSALKLIFHRLACITAEGQGVGTVEGDVDTGTGLAVERFGDEFLDQGFACAELLQSCVAVGDTEGPFAIFGQREEASRGAGDELLEARFPSVGIANAEAAAADQPAIDNTGVFGERSAGRRRDAGRDFVDAGDGDVETDGTEQDRIGESQAGGQGDDGGLGVVEGVGPAAIRGDQESAVAVGSGLGSFRQVGDVIQAEFQAAIQLSDGGFHRSAA